ncbi:imidazole glycerol phosphate synthase subunit HisH [Maridesulfovibrio frigidus]|uniref:imidazole glycerol phosphate synthase subunit HisH n=1 Tax=Maridesulfovibrio frigidus TaxID=340956 RepID=UPI00146FAA91|nr:imidazole glycerol phosphate synthase subunit HisH [Maridesulfovibrio frigidus]
MAKKVNQMKQTIGVVNIGSCCNIFNISKALNFIDASVVIVETAEDLEKVDKILLPGVGNFKHALEDLEQRELIAPLTEAIKIKHTLGICLGMQILAEVGFEDGENKGLSIIPGKVERMDENLELPHLGWRKLQMPANKNILFEGIEATDEFYFMHSYEFKNDNVAIATADYNGYNFISAVAQENIFGLQFHPEKSNSQGIRILSNFYNL